MIQCGELTPDPRADHVGGIFKAPGSASYAILES